MYKLSPYILQLFAWVPGRIALYFFLNLRVIGQENIKAATLIKKNSKVGVIFSCTHVSEFDPIVVLAGVKPFTRLFPMFYVSAPVKEFREGNYGWRNFFYNSIWFFKAWGSYPLIRGVHDYGVSLKDHESILNDGCSLCIFPYGGIKNAKPEPGGGVGYLALKTNAIVIPTEITLERPDGANFTSRKWTMTISYGDPKQFSGDFSDVDYCKFVAKECMKLE